MAVISRHNTLWETIRISSIKQGRRLKFRLPNGIALLPAMPSRSSKCHFASAIIFSNGHPLSLHSLIARHGESACVQDDSELTVHASSSALSLHPAHSDTQPPVLAIQEPTRVPVCHH